ncbi:MAG TPA: hypothetical protein VNY84_08245 [Acidimicrobiales bacterium]|nr:hypothetical protein [Acidimicrobiales bacterium]
MPATLPPDWSAVMLGGRYRLDTRLGSSTSEGNEWWQATDTVLARPVLVELGQLGIESSLAGTGRLAHPNVASVYDTGAEGGRQWVVAELPRGRSLRNLLDRHGPLAPGPTVGIGVQVCAALAAAHRIGVSHGHLDLDRVIVSKEGRVKVGGFTGAGSPAGDVTAAGRLLYELLCGHRPDDGTPVAPRLLRPGVPPALEDVVLGALGGGNRSITDAETLRSALADVDVGTDDAIPDVVREPTPPAGTGPLRQRRRRPWWEPAAVALVVIVAAAAIALAVVSRNGSGNGPTAPGRAGGAGAISVAKATAFDPPPGDGKEDDAALPLLIDGKPDTVWSTEFYATRDFGHLKKGVGVYLTLNGPTKLRTLAINSPSRGWLGQVYVANAPPPSALAGWGRPVASFAVNGQVTSVSLGGAQGSLVLVWITDLGSAPPPQVKVDIGELSLSS